MTYEQRLAQTYLQARERVIKAIERRLSYGQAYSQQQALLTIINDELSKLGVDAATLQGVQARESFLAGAADTYRVVKHPDTMPAYSYFTGLHKDALSICVDNAKAYAQISAQMIARQAADMVRSIGLQATTDKLAQNLTWQETRKSIERMLADNEFVTVPWRNGKGNMRVDSYADLVARTTTNEATTTGLLAEMDRLGEGLVKMTTHSPTCPICATRQGRVYRLTDYPAGDPRSQFPHISMALPRWPTYKTVHPCCRHRLGPYIWSERTDAERETDLSHAGDTFEGDPRSEKQIAAYQHALDVKRARLTDRKQWEKYRAVLGEKNTPTFSGFRSMKAAGSEAYTDMQSDYRYALKVMRKDDILISTYHKLPTTGTSDGVKDLVDATGRVKQRRLYGADGHAAKDIDTDDHKLPKTHPYGPHVHEWPDGVRDKAGRALTAQEKRQNKDILGGDKSV